MEHEVRYSTSLASVAEDLFVEVFCDTFGPEKTEYLSVQYPFVDIYTAIENLQKMRERGESIALLYHATGTGKTVTAVSDAKHCGERTLFLAHTRELVTQAKETFEDIWPGKQSGMYVAEQKNADVYVICASIQSVAQNLEQFKPDDFGYIIIDECHHGTVNTYKKLLGYFKPKFTLGLTATPERTDGEDLLELFRNVAHKLDLKTAVEIGELTPIRCIRVKTNVDLSTVRINGIKYYSQDLESNSKRAEILQEYEYGSINVLCAGDLLNEGWDSPKTTVLGTIKYLKPDMVLIPFIESAFLYDDKRTTP